MKSYEQQIEKLREKIELDRGTRQDLREIELDMLTSMTLADAVRLGGTVSGQSHTSLGDNGDTCALGAAILAGIAAGIEGLYIIYAGPGGPSQRIL